MDDIKSRITSELDSRIQRLEAHQNDQPVQTDNQYAELNQALAHVIRVPLLGELTSLRDFVDSL